MQTDRRKIATPVRIEEISREWLDSVLESADIAPIRGFTATPFGDGLYGSIAKVALSYGSSAESGPRTLIVKLPADDEEMRGALRTIGIYSRECRFYTEIAGRLPIRTPKCYFAAVDPASGDTVLLLEYIEGEVFDDLKGATRRQANEAFRLAAKLHSSMEADPLLDADWIERMGAPPLLDSVIAATRAGMDVGAERLQGLMPDWMATNALRSDEIIGTQLAELDRLQQTLVHLDYRLPNMIFPSTGEGAPTLVDFHGAMSGPGVVDLAMFATHAISVNDRREWLDELIDMYLELVQGRAERTRPQWFDTAWKRATLFFTFNCVRNAGVLDMDDPTTNETISVWVERCAAMAEDLDAVGLLNESKYRTGGTR